MVSFCSPRVGKFVVTAQIRSSESKKQNNIFWDFFLGNNLLFWNSTAIIYSGSIVCLKVLHLSDYQRKHAEQASGVWGFSLLWCLIKPAANKIQRGGEITDATCLSLELDEALQGSSIKVRHSTEREETFANNHKFGASSRKDRLWDVYFLFLFIPGEHAYACS